MQCYVCSEKGHYARECPQRRDKVNTQSHHGDSASFCALVASSKEADSHEQGDIKVNKLKAGYVEPTREEKRALMGTDPDEIWFTDSGASAHITFRREWLTEYRPSDHGSTIILGDGHECPVVGEGTVRVRRLINESWSEAEIRNVLYVPSMGKNLYSVG